MLFDPGTLYLELLNKISEKNKQPNKTDLIESCFWLACKYWETLKKCIDSSFFENEVNEINFFKTIKPKFTSIIQFYSMLAESQIFIPEDIDIQAEYWRNELKRYLRFRKRNKEFVDYYESKATDMDNTRFTRVPPDWVPAFPPLVYDADKNFCSTHDHLIRGLLANQMYHAYVMEQLLLVTNEI